MENVDKYGDSSLLEIIVSSFLLSENSKVRPNAEHIHGRPVSLIPEEEELDLGKILSLHDHEFRPSFDIDQGPPSEAETAEKEFQVLFRRDDSSKDLFLANYFTDDERLAPLKPVEGVPPPGMKKPLRFQQTQNDAYRTFMEELILVKCCTKQILQLLEETKSLLGHEVQIHNDPGFGSISEVQAWVWILREAIVTSYTSAISKNDKTRISQQDKLVNRTFSSIEKLFKNFYQDIKSLMRTFDKVEAAFHGLANKAMKRFSLNKDAALEYELKAPAFNFLFHHPIGSRDSFEDCCSGKFKPRTSKNMTCDNDDDKVPSNTKVVPERNLVVRCSVDGITIRSGVTDNPWLKFQNVDRLEDQQAFMNIFLHAFCKGVVTSRQNVGWANEILEVHRRLFQRKGVQFKDSVLTSIQKCKGIIETPKKIFNFFPKEEVMMTYSLKSAFAGFSLIKPLLYDLMITAHSQQKLITELCSERRLLKHPNKVSKRVPLDRLAKFEIEIEDTKIQVAMILNRYPNLREARKMKEKLEKKEVGQESEKEITGDESNMALDVPVETVYRCPSELYSTPSTQEMLELFRKMIDDERTMCLQPNPAHFLLKDIELEYNDKAVACVSKREITPDMVSLCSDPIRYFYQVTEEINSAKEGIIGQLMRATENLLYSELHHDSDIDQVEPGSLFLSEKLVPTSFWIQIICKLFHVWDFHSVPKHLQAHFQSVNDKTLNWLEKLESSFAEFENSFNKFKNDFIMFHEYVESMHGFATWVKKNFHFKIPSEVLAKWRNQIHAESLELEGLEVGGSTSDANLPTFKLNFSNFDVDLIRLDEERVGTYVLSLNKCSGNVQVGLVSTFFTHLDSIIKRATVNLNASQSILEKNFSIKPLKFSLCVDKKLNHLKYLTNLEDLVMALTFEKNYKIIKEIVAYIEILDRAVSQFNRLLQTVQLQMEDRGVIESGRMSRKDRIRKKVLQEDAEHFNHDIWLNETKRILRKSVEAMPVTYEIQDVSVKNSLMKWAQIAETDKRLKDYVRSRAMLLMGQEEDEDTEETQDKVEADVEGKQVDDENDAEDKKDSPRSEETISNIALESLPINFEDAMMQTTFGKAFFPDPIHFNADIERWRAVCFKMLATALDKFREMTTTKIIDTKNTLSQPCLSQPLAKQEDKDESETKDQVGEEKSPEVEKETPKMEKKEEETKDKSDTKDQERVHETDNVDEIKETTNTPEGETAEAMKVEIRNVAYTEGLCSFLCFITSHLNPRDKVFISSSELKQLQDKFYAVTTAVEKFKKDLDSTERVLVNSLSLAMASVEYKNLPDFLPLSPLESDYLKAHDVEEIATRREYKKERTSFDLKLFTNLQIWKRNEKNLNPPSATSLLTDPYEIELYWDSTEKTKLFCRFTKSDDSQWFELSQLHIAAQLRLIHLLIDEIMKGFQKARELVKESKNDLACAKKLLQRTWKGIRKDMKKGIIPDSGVLVLVKLYRHQIATAVVNTKAIMNTAREVRFLLSQSVRNAKAWVKDEPNIQPMEYDKNFAMLKVVLKPAVPRETWVIRKEEKTKLHLPSPPPTHSKEEKVVHIMPAVDVKSSTSLEHPDGLMSELGIHKSLDQKPSNQSLVYELRETLGRKLIGASGRDFHSIATTIETLMLSSLEQSLAILKQPNCSITYPPGEGITSREITPNVIGILVALAAATKSLSHFKDIVPVQRNFMVEKVRELDDKLNKIRSPGSGMGNFLLHEVRKIKTEVEQLDKNFRGKFCYKTEFPPIGEVSVGPFQPAYGLSPMEFVEGLAVATKGHVWTVISGVPEIGVVIKDNKTLESHALSNLPLKARLEIFLSLLTFMEKLVEYVRENLEGIKKDIEVAKSLERTHGKTIMKRKRHFPGKTSKNDMSKWEVEENIHSFARIVNACIKAEDSIILILDLLRQSHELLQQVMSFIVLKMRLEPVPGVPTVDADFLHRTHHWLAVEGTTGNAPPPNIPPPMMLKKIKRTQKEEIAQMKYKAAWEHRLFELEVSFETYSRNHHIAVDVPLMFIPANKNPKPGLSEIFADMHVKM